MYEGTTFLPTTCCYSLGSTPAPPLDSGLRRNDGKEALDSGLRRNDDREALVSGLRRNDEIKIGFVGLR